jgi:hypothetical protein
MADIRQPTLNDRRKATVIAHSVKYELSPGNHCYLR